MLTSEEFLQERLHEHKSQSALRLFFVQTPLELGLVPSMGSSFHSGNGKGDL